MEIILNILHFIVDFFHTHGFITICMLVGGGLVCLAFIIGMIGDASRIVKDMFFEHWLAKDENFLQYKTLPEARRGYRRYLQEKEYLRYTKALYRKREKRLAKDAPKDIFKLGKKKFSFQNLRKWRYLWDNAAIKAYDTYEQTKKSLARSYAASLNLFLKTRDFLNKKEQKEHLKNDLPVVIALGESDDRSNHLSSEKRS